MSGAKIPKLAIDPHRIKHSLVAVRKHTRADERIFCDFCGKEIPLGETMYIVVTDAGYAYISCQHPER